jgi:hypothetical protein
VAGDDATGSGRDRRPRRLPWSDTDVVATRLFRLWPFPRNWRVVSRLSAELAETTMIVEEPVRPRGWGG